MTKVPFTRVYRCDENSDGCGHMAPMLGGVAPPCCPECGSNELMFGAGRVVPDGSVVEWRRFKRFQNPDAAHIPFAANRARSVAEMPWRAAGAKIILDMLRGEDKKKMVETVSGESKELVIPYTPGHMGEQSERTKGIVIAFGAGEVPPAGGFISPEHDFGVYLGAVVLISPSSGNPFVDGLAQYRSISVWDIEAVLNPKYGKAVYQRLRTQAQRDLAPYQTNFETVGWDALTIHDLGSSEAEKMGAAIEEARRRHGKSTKTQVLVHGLRDDK